MDSMVNTILVGLTRIPPMDTFILKICLQTPVGWYNNGHYDYYYYADGTKAIGLAGRYETL